VIRTEDMARELGGVERGLMVRGERLTRLSVTAITAVIALLTFAFSFGNVWQLGRRLGIAAWMAPLVGPSVDLSVVGLLVAVRRLSMHGIPSGQLRAARTLLVWCGLVMLALNVSEPIAAGRYAAAAFDSVAPLLLIGWSEVGPRLGPRASRRFCSLRPARSMPITEVAAGVQSLLTPFAANCGSVLPGCELSPVGYAPAHLARTSRSTSLVP
jgi:Protein of unknown function (DUF2637)